MRISHVCLTFLSLYRNEIITRFRDWIFFLICDAFQHEVITIFPEKCAKHGKRFVFQWRWCYIKRKEHLCNFLRLHFLYFFALLFETNYIAETYLWVFRPFSPRIWICETLIPLQCQSFLDLPMLKLVYESKIFLITTLSFKIYRTVVNHSTS